MSSISSFLRNRTVTQTKQKQFNNAATSIVEKQEVGLSKLFNNIIPETSSKKISLGYTIHVLKFLDIIDLSQLVKTNRNLKQIYKDKFLMNFITFCKREDNYNPFHQTIKKSKFIKSVQELNNNSILKLEMNFEIIYPKLKFFFEKHLNKEEISDDIIIKFLNLINGYQSVNLSNKNNIYFNMHLPTQLINIFTRKNMRILIYSMTFVGFVNFALTSTTDHGFYRRFMDYLLSQKYYLFDTQSEMKKFVDNFFYNKDFFKEYESPILDYNNVPDSNGKYVVSVMNKSVFYSFRTFDNLASTVLSLFPHVLNYAMARKHKTVFPGVNHDDLSNVIDKLKELNTNEILSIECFIKYLLTIPQNERGFNLT